MGITWRRPTPTELRDTGMAFLLGVLVAAFIAVMHIQATEREAAAAFAAATATSSVPASAADMEELAARFDATIVWTDSDRNCGVGCFWADTPNVIYVSPGMDAESTRHVVLHEIGHVLHHRVGMPVDECAADLFAQSMGSTMGGYCPV